MAGVTCDKCGKYSEYVSGTAQPVLVLSDCRYNHIEFNCDCGTLWRIFQADQQYFITTISKHMLTMRLYDTPPPEVIVAFGRLQPEPSVHQLRALQFAIWEFENGGEV